jgi:hypothetical protein
LYEVWLVEREPLADLARAVAMVYELHFRFQYDDVTRGRIVHLISAQLYDRVRAKGAASHEPGE